MRWFSTDPEQPGVFAVGQLAQGIFALGQMATGVIAIGQLARGVIAVGQGAVGFVAIGQGALGIFYGIGMVGVVGRGRGWVLKLLPEVRVERPVIPTVPPPRALASLQSDGDHGWVEMKVHRGELEDGAALVLSEETRLQLAAARDQGHDRCFARVVVEREVEEDAGGYRAAPESRILRRVERVLSWSSKTRVRLHGPFTSIGGLVLRMFGMIALAGAWWLLAGADIWQTIVVVFLKP